jgi:hypothetical protein
LATHYNKPDTVNTIVYYVGFIVIHSSENTWLKHTTKFTIFIPTTAQ